jgi:hypothetical protein
VERYSSYSFSALDAGDWSASRPGRTLAPGKGSPVPTVQEAGCAPEPVWTQRLEEKSSCLCRGSNLDRPIVEPVVRHYTFMLRSPVQKSLYILIVNISIYFVLQPVLFSFFLPLFFPSSHTTFHTSISERDRTSLQCFTVNPATGCSLLMHSIYCGSSLCISIPRRLAQETNIL